MRKALAISFGIALLAAGIALFAFPRIEWDGAAVCTLDILVRDAQGNPIPNTTLILKYADFTGDRMKNQELSNYPIARITADPKGHGVITHAFPSGGSSWFLFRTGSIGFDDFNILAEHDGYLSTEIAVSSFAGSRRNIRASRTIQIELKLTQEPAAVLDLTDPVSVAFVGGCPDGGSTQGKLIDSGGREYPFFIDRRLQTQTYGRWYVGEDVHTGKADLLAEDDARIGAIQAVLLAWLNRVTTMDERKRLAKLDHAPPGDETWSTDEKLQAHARWFIARHFMKTTD